MTFNFTEAPSSGAELPVGPEQWGPAVTASGGGVHKRSAAMADAFQENLTSVFTVGGLGVGLPML